MKYRTAARRAMPLVLLMILLLASCGPEKTRSAEAAMGRERARDGVSNARDAVAWEIPDVPGLCEELGLKGSRVDIGDCSLFVEQEGKGIPVVLIHGGPGATHHGFHPSFSKAADFARVIYYDQRGCGLSDHEPGEGYSVEQAADDLEKLRKRLGLDRWVVLGHSYGGLLAQRYTTLYPEKVLGLVVVCGATGLHKRDQLRSRQGAWIMTEERAAMGSIAAEINARADAEGWPASRRIALSIYNSHLNGDWKRQSFYRPDEEVIARKALYGWRNDFERDFNAVMSRSERSESLRGAFRDCPIPTLIMDSSWDMTWSESKPARLAENHPNGRLIMFSRSGHEPFNDEPAEFFRVLKEFVVACRSTDRASAADYAARMRDFKPGMDDPFLAAPPSDLEKKALAEAKAVRQRILEGKEFFDLSSPLSCHLSYLSAINNLDLSRAERIRCRRCTLKGLEEDRNWLDDLEAWRAPEPPAGPERGQLWPVYVTDRRSGEWADTHMFIFWDGCWRRAGNLGGPYYDWRESETFFIKDLLRNLI